MNVQLVMLLPFLEEQLGIGKLLVLELALILMDALINNISQLLYK
ncbi:MULTISPECIES: hypothetical protein [Eikenella]|nr:MULTISPECIES: hypothetical protein [Eikenella]